MPGSIVFCLFVCGFCSFFILIFYFIFFLQWSCSIDHVAWYPVPLYPPLCGHLKRLVVSWSPISTMVITLWFIIWPYLTQLPHLPLLVSILEIPLLSWVSITIHSGVFSSFIFSSASFHTPPAITHCQWRKSLTLMTLSHKWVVIHSMCFVLGTGKRVVCKQTKIPALAYILVEVDG